MPCTRQHAHQHSHVFVVLVLLLTFSSPWHCRCLLILVYPGRRVDQLLVPKQQSVIFLAYLIVSSVVDDRLRHRPYEPGTSEEMPYKGSHHFEAAHNSFLSDIPPLCAVYGHCYL